VLSTMLKPSVTGRIRCSHLRTLEDKMRVIARLRNFSRQASGTPISESDGLEPFL